MHQNLLPIQMFSLPANPLTPAHAMTQPDPNIAVVEPWPEKLCCFHSHVACCSVYIAVHQVQFKPARPLTRTNQDGPNRSCVLHEGLRRWRSLRGDIQDGRRSHREGQVASSGTTHQQTDQRGSEIQG